MGPAPPCLRSRPASQATCTPKALKDVSGQSGAFTKYYISFSAFGCGFGPEEITRITLASTQQQAQQVCVSDVRFL